MHANSYESRLLQKSVNEKKNAKIPSLQNTAELYPGQIYYLVQRLQTYLTDFSKEWTPK